jgi:hypothetical protein
MNEMSGDRVWDYSGQGNHGTCINMSPQSPTSGWGPGPHGGALGFDGSNDYISVAGEPLFASINGLTAIAWVKTTTTGKVILDKGISSLYDSYQLYISSGKVRFYITLNTNQDKYITGATSIVDGLLHQLVGVWNGSNIYFYLDGKSDKTPVAASGTMQYNTTQPLIIGRNGLLLPANSYVGNLSSVSIYNRALSAEEIAYLYSFPYCMFEQPAYPAWMVPESLLFKPLSFPNKELVQQCRSINTMSINSRINKEQVLQRR